MAVPRLSALRQEHLAQAVELSSALAWPYREADWRFAFELGRGFAMESDGRLVGTALWWPHGDRHASLGMIIVAARMQGRGIGRALTVALLDDAGDRSTILNSTLEGVPLYTRLGFRPYGGIFQHQAIVEVAAPEVAPDGIRPFRDSDEGSLSALDLAASGMDRSALLRALLRVGRTTVVDRGHGVDAYACVREFGRGVVIGPVAARATADAQALIETLVGRHRGRFVRVDVTDDCGISPWLSGIGLPRVGDALSMVRGSRVAATDQARLFALSNQSFG